MYITTFKSSQEEVLTTDTIKLLRLKAGLSQQALADILGVRQQAVAKWESGVAYPRAQQLPALAEALGCEIGELYAGKEKTE